jgi:hypothetical protein
MAIVYILFGVVEENMYTTSVHASNVQLMMKWPFKILNGMIYNGEQEWAEVYFLLILKSVVLHGAIRSQSRYVLIIKRKIYSLY